MRISFFLKDTPKGEKKDMESTVFSPGFFSMYWHIDPLEKRVK